MAGSAKAGSLAETSVWVMTLAISRPGTMLWNLEGASYAIKGCGLKVISGLADLERPFGASTRRECRSRPW